jgi:hypothetical protein
MTDENASEADLLATVEQAGAKADEYVEEYKSSSDSSERIALLELARDELKVAVKAQRELLRLRRKKG